MLAPYRPGKPGDDRRVESVTRGIDPQLSCRQAFSMKGGWVYIVTNKRDGVLYVGVTSNLAKRVWEHRKGVVPGFTKRYGCKLLVWFAAFEDIQDARAHELRMKKWNRAWKLREIEEMNPLWNDLFPTLGP